VPGNISQQVLQIARSNLGWATRTSGKVLKAGHQPAYELIPENPPHEYWLVTFFAPPFDNLDFRTLINIQTRTVGPTEDPFDR
uniref:hypothetical protein n=1 Tax=Proteus terrae TaxID=1574161 RepID=UPI00301C6E40